MHNAAIPKTLEAITRLILQELAELHSPDGQQLVPLFVDTGSRSVTNPKSSHVDEVHVAVEMGNGSQIIIQALGRGTATKDLTITTRHCQVGERVDDFHVEIPDCAMNVPYLEGKINPAHELREAAYAAAGSVRNVYLGMGYEAGPSMAV